MQRPEVWNNFHHSWLLQKSWKVKAVHIPSKRLKYIYAKQNFPVTQPWFYFYHFLFPWLHYHKDLLLLAPAPTDTQLYTNKTFSGRDGSAPNTHPHVYRCIWLKFQNLTTHKSQQFMCWARWYLQQANIRIVFLLLLWLQNQGGHWREEEKEKQIYKDHKSSKEREGGGETEGKRKDEGWWVGDKARSF